jgi:malic enzyme
MLRISTNSLRQLKRLPLLGGINLEDIKAPESFEIERRLVEELDIPVMHDDQHGTQSFHLPLY